MLFVTYRQNDLFAKYVPQILEGLPVAGTFIIPAGTELQDHKDAYIAALEGASATGATHFLTDDTCMPSQYKQITGQVLQGFPEQVWNHTTYLNPLFSNQVAKWTQGANASENLVWFANQVANGQPVKRVIIVQDLLTDHGFPGTGAPERRDDLWSSWISETLKVNFSCDILVVDDLKAALVHGADLETMIVVDRHAGIKEVMTRENGWYHSLRNWPHKAMLFALPLETCASQLFDRQTMPYSFDVNEMRAEIKRAAGIS